MTGNDIKNEIGDILFNEETIARAVGEMAHRISEDYAGKTVVVISVLKGAFVFTTDLVRNITVPVMVEFLHASSYAAATTPSGPPVLGLEPSADLRGKHVLVVDTIVDTGGTLHAVASFLTRSDVASARTAVLLDKSCRRTHEVVVNYKAFDVPDIFVVGYGLDYKGSYRNLPYIASLK